jgi:hypothetical protein
MNQVAGQIICPKCGFSQARSDTCMRCGIVLRKFHAKRTSEKPPEEIARKQDSDTSANGVRRPGSKLSMERFLGLIAVLLLINLTGLPVWITLPAALITIFLMTRSYSRAIRLVIMTLTGLISGGAGFGTTTAAILGIVVPASILIVPATISLAYWALSFGALIVRDYREWLASGPTDSDANKMILIGAASVAVAFFAIMPVMAGLHISIGILGKMTGVLNPGSSGESSSIFISLMSVIAIAVGLNAAYRGGFWRLRQLNQLRNLPTSKAGSAALGLAEFSGTARSTNPGEPVLISSTVIRYEDETPSTVLDNLRSFYLEDDTGRILVDPSGAHVRSRWWKLQFSTQICDIVLRRNVEKSGDLLSLKDGDPVYVIGSVEINNASPAGAAGSEALVLHRRKRPVEGSFWKYLLGSGRHDNYDIFFLSDSSEESAEEQIRTGLKWTWFLSSAWIFFSLVFLLTEWGIIPF